MSTTRGVRAPATREPYLVFGAPVFGEEEIAGVTHSLGDVLVPGASG